MLPSVIAPPAMTCLFSVPPWLRLASVALALCMANACASHAPGPDRANNVGIRFDWPETAETARAFGGGNMFIERDEGTVRAWVMPSADHDAGQALEFFSGELQKVASRQADDSRRVQGFVDENGRSHVAAAESYVYDATDPTANDGARYFGGRGYFIDFFQDTLYAQSSGGTCDLELQPIRIQHQLDPDRPSKSAIYDKILMYLDEPSAECPNGRWMSEPRAALDLGDGTMLLTMPSQVVRVRMSDLLPLASAPRFKVIDAEKIKAVVEDIKARGDIADPNEYLSRKLAAGG